MTLKQKKSLLNGLTEVVCKNVTEFPAFSLIKRHFRQMTNGLLIAISRIKTNHNKQHYFTNNLYQ